MGTMRIDARALSFGSGRWLRTARCVSPTRANSSICGRGRSRPRTQGGPNRQYYTVGTMGGKRDEFSTATKDYLAKRVGYRCSLPNCRAPTSGPGDSETASNVGVAAHIRAARPGGPRYDPSQTSDDRKSHQNGIWVCSGHGKHIDDASSTFTVEKLIEYKNEAENRAKFELNRPLPIAGENEALIEKFSDRLVEKLQAYRDNSQSRRLSNLEIFDRQVRHALAEHAEILESGAVTPEELLNEPEFQRIADNYAVEAQREALLERARMLAYALVGTLCSENLTISQKSRVERVIRELDPADVLLLHRLSLVRIEQQPNDSFDREGMKRMEMLGHEPLSCDVLRASGCVNWENNGGFDGGVNYAYITSIGRNVLDILRSYAHDLSSESWPLS
jgi:hypothetical protein